MGGSGDTGSGGRPAMTVWPPYPAAVPEPWVARPVRLAWLPFPVQVVLTGAVAYAVIATWTVVGGVFSEGLQTIGFAIISTPLTILVFLLGLPLRLVPRARAWWFRRAWWPVALAVVAVVGLAASYVVPGSGPVHYDATDEWPASDGYDPNEWVFLPALGALAFALMHVLPPRAVVRRVM